MSKNKKRGIILIAAYLVVMILFILGGAFVVRSIAEKRAADRAIESMQVFYLADAGINRAIDELRADYDNWAGVNNVPLGNGQYTIVITVPNPNPDDERIVTATGSIPNSAAPRVERELEVTIRRSIPADFYNNALYAAGEVDLNGNAYTVDGDITYGDGPISGVDPNLINGTVTQEPSASPLPLLDFAGLRIISQGQNNVYDAARLQAVKNGTDNFPGTFFWFEDPLDPSNSIPNVVYLEADLELKGNIGTIGGFYVVDGDVITNSSGSYDVEINGNGQIDGCIYTTGEFRINGGGGGLNVSGGVWADDLARLNGNATVGYNEDYMKAIKSTVTPDVQTTSWREVF